jgi:hypothetical protein
MPSSILLGKSARFRVLTGFVVGAFSSSLAAFSAPAMAADPVDPLPSGERSDRAPTIYVKDLRHLASLVKKDEVVFPMADSLATRQTVGTTLAVTGLVVGAALAILSFTVLAKKECSSPFGLETCDTKFNMPVMYTGFGTMIVLPLVGMAIRPGRDDLLDVVNTWNERHPNSQFEITSK